MSDINITADSSQVVALDRALQALKETIRKADATANETAKAQGKRSQAYKDQKAAIAALKVELVELNEKSSLAKFEANLRRSVQDAKALGTALAEAGAATRAASAYKGLAASPLFAGGATDTRDMVQERADLTRELRAMENALRGMGAATEMERQQIANMNVAMTQLRGRVEELGAALADIRQRGGLLAALNLGEAGRSGASFGRLGKDIYELREMITQMRAEYAQGLPLPFDEASRRSLDEFAMRLREAGKEAKALKAIMAQMDPESEDYDELSSALSEVTAKMRSYRDAIDVISDSRKVEAANTREATRVTREAEAARKAEAAAAKKQQDIMQAQLALLQKVSAAQSAYNDRVGSRVEAERHYTAAMALQTERYEAAQAAARALTAEQGRLLKTTSSVAAAHDMVARATYESTLADKAAIAAAASLNKALSDEAKAFAARANAVEDLQDTQRRLNVTVTATEEAIEAASEMFTRHANTINRTSDEYDRLRRAAGLASATLAGGAALVAPSISRYGPDGSQAASGAVRATTAYTAALQANSQALRAGHQAQTIYTRGLGVLGENVGRVATTLAIARTQLQSLAYIFGLFTFARLVVQLDTLNESLRANAAATQAAGLSFMSLDAIIKGNEAFFEALADTYGTRTKDIAGSYNQLATSALQAGISLQATNDVFEGVAAAATVFGKSTAEMEGMLQALSQMANKGVVSMEEFRQQLAERLPGAFTIAAESMNMTTEEFIKLVSSGNLTAQELFPAFGPALIKQFGAAAEGVMGINRAFRELGQALDGGVLAALDSGMREGIIAFADSLERLLESDAGQRFFTDLGEAANSALSALASVFDILARGNGTFTFLGMEVSYLDAALYALGATIAFIMGKSLLAMSTGIIAMAAHLAGVTKGLTLAAGAAKLFMLALGPVGVAIGLVAAAGVALAVTFQKSIPQGVDYGVAKINSAVTAMQTLNAKMTALNDAATAYRVDPTEANADRYQKALRDLKVAQDDVTRSSGSLETQLASQQETFDRLSGAAQAKAAEIGEVLKFGRESGLDYNANMLLGPLVAELQALRAEADVAGAAVSNTETVLKNIGLQAEIVSTRLAGMTNALTQLYGMAQGGESSLERIRAAMGGTESLANFDAMIERQAKLNAMAQTFGVSAAEVEVQMQKVAETMGMSAEEARLFAEAAILGEDAVTAVAATADEAAANTARMAGSMATVQAALADSKALMGALASGGVEAHEAMQAQQAAAADMRGYLDDAAGAMGLTEAAAKALSDRMGVSAQAAIDLVNNVDDAQDGLSDSQRQALRLVQELWAGVSAANAMAGAARGIAAALSSAVALAASLRAQMATMGASAVDIEAQTMAAEELTAAYASGDAEAVAAAERRNAEVQAQIQVNTQLRQSEAEVAAAREAAVVGLMESTGRTRENAEAVVMAQQAFAGVATTQQGLAAAGDVLVGSMMRQYDAQVQLTAAQTAFNEAQNAGGGGGGGGGSDAIDDLTASYQDLLDTMQGYQAETSSIAGQETGFGDMRQDVEDFIREMEKAGVTVEQFEANLGQTPDALRAMADGMDEARAQAERVQDTVEDLADSLTDAFSDFLDRGLKDFGQFFKDIFGGFKKMLIDMISEAARSKIIMPVFQAMGLGGGGGAAQAAAGAVSSAGTGLMGQISGLAGGFVSGITSGLQAALGAGGFTSAGIFNVAANAATAAATGVGTLAATIGAAIPVVAGIAAVFSFFKTKTKLLDSGLRVTIDGVTALTETFQVIEKKKFWGLSRKVRETFSAANDELSAAVQDTYSNLRTSVLDMGSVLGMSADALNGFVAEIKLSTKDMTEEEAQKAVLAEFEDLGNKMAGRLLGSFTRQVIDADLVASLERRLAGFGSGANDSAGERWLRDRQRRELQAQLAAAQAGRTVTYLNDAFEQLRNSGESSLDLLTRLSSSFLAANEAMRALGSDLFRTTIAGIRASAQLVEAMGGLQEFQSKVDYYFTNFFSEEDQLAFTTETLRRAFREVKQDFQRFAGRTLPDTRREYVNMVQGLDLTTEAGRAMYAMLVGNAPAFDAMFDALEAAGGAAADLTDRIVALESRRAEVLGELEARYNALIAAEKTLADTRSSLQASDAAPGNEITQLNVLRRQFNTAIAAARNGNPEAATDASRLAQELLSQGQVVFGANRSYADLFRNVNTALMQAQTALGNAAAPIERRLTAENFEEVTQRTTNQLLRALGSIDSRLQALNERQEQTDRTQTARAQRTATGKVA